MGVGGGKPKDDTKMTEGRVGVWEKMTDDNDRGGGNSRKAILIKKKIELDPNFLMFWVCGSWGGEDFGKVVEHEKGAQKKLQCLHANITNRGRGGTLVSIIPIK